MENQVKDIVPELLDAVQKDFRKSYQGNAAIEKILKMIEDGTATYKQANDLSVWTGQLLSASLKRHITPDALPDGKMYYNIADRILGEMLGEDHDLIANAAEKIQESMNKSAGLGIKAVRPELNQSRVDGLVNRLASGELFEDVQWLLGEPIVNFSQSVVDDAIKDNAEFHSEAGLDPVIVRTVDSKPCKWCQEVAGTYTYPDVPNDVYRRHERCRCTVEYVPVKSSRQNVWTKRWS